MDEIKHVIIVTMEGQAITLHQIYDHYNVTGEKPHR